MLESTALPYIISSNQGNDDYLRELVHTLSKKYPHDIENGFYVAQNYVTKLTDAAQSLGNSISINDNIAYAKNNVELFSNTLVNFILGNTQKPVAMIYKLNKEINSYFISIRGSKNCKCHLGRVVNNISSDLGGSGGGHVKACGAVIPTERLDEFIDTLNKYLIC